MLGALGPSLLTDSIPRTAGSVLRLIAILQRHASFSALRHRTQLRLILTNVSKHSEATLTLPEGTEHRNQCLISESVLPTAAAIRLLDPWSPAALKRWPGQLRLGFCVLFSDKGLSEVTGSRTLQFLNNTEVRDCPPRKREPCV